MGETAALLADCTDSQHWIAPVEQELPPAGAVGAGAGVLFGIAVATARIVKPTSVEVSLANMAL